MTHATKSPSREVALAAAEIAFRSGILQQDILACRQVCEDAISESERVLKAGRVPKVHSRWLRLHFSAQVMREFFDEAEHAA